MNMPSHSQDCSLLGENLSATDVVTILVSQVPLATVEEDYYNMDIPVSNQCAYVCVHVCVILFYCLMFMC